MQIPRLCTLEVSSYTSKVSRTLLKNPQILICTAYILYQKFEYFWVKFRNSFFGGFVVSESNIRDWSLKQKRKQIKIFIWNAKIATFWSHWNYIFIQKICIFFPRTAGKVLNGCKLQTQCYDAHWFKSNYSVRINVALRLFIQFFAFLLVICKPKINFEVFFKYIALS